MSTRQYIHKHNLRPLFGLTIGMVRALGKPDVAACADSMPGDDLYSIERIENWADNNAERINRAGVDAGGLPEVGLAHHTLDWAHTVTIQPLEISLVVWQAAQQLPWDLAPEQRKIAFIRHNMTNYPFLLKELARKPGCRAGYLVLRARVDDMARKWLRL